MNKLLFLSFLTIGLPLHGVVVHLPNAKTLTDRFHQAQLDHFIGNTEIIKNLSDQLKEPLSVVDTVEKALADYYKHVQNPVVENCMKQKKSKIIKLILKDSPKAIKELKDLGKLPKKTLLSRSEVLSMMFRSAEKV